MQAGEAEPKESFLLFFFNGIKSRRCPPAMGGCTLELHRKSMCALLQPCCGVQWGYYIWGERLVLLGWFGLMHSLG